MKRVVVAAAAAMLMAGTAQAQTQPPAQGQAPRAAPPRVPTRVTAAVLGQVCGQDRSACLTYVLGAADAWASALIAAGRPQIFCVPRGTTNEQIAQSAATYLRAHPEESATNASMVVLAALKSSYPCPS